MADNSQYKDRLETMLAEITEELKTLGVHNPEVPEDWEAVPADVDVAQADPNVSADRVEDWEERRAVLAQLETRFNNIRRALKKIEAGNFGTCEIGGEKIETDRLDANPAARTCQEHINNEADLPRV